MTAPLLQRFANGFRGETAVELRVRIFRLICGLAGALSLLVIAPLNAMQNLPLGVHVANLALGLGSLFCYWRSCRGHHHYAFFLGVLVVLLDVMWFLNAGSDGSVTHYFYPVMLFVITMFTGPSRWILAVGLWINVTALFLVEQRYPGLVVPFESALDRLIDLETGILCSFVALGSVAWFILASYQREQRRVVEIATRLSASEAKYREIFDSTNDALLVLDAGGRIVAANERAGTLLASDREQIVGRRMGDYSQGASPYGESEAAEHLRLALLAQPQLFEWRSRRSNGELFWSEVALRGWETGGEPRAIAAIRDISSRKAALEALRLNEERLRMAMAASSQGWFELNPQTGETVSSAEYARMLEYEPAEFSSNLQAWIDRIHPADRDGALTVYRQMLESGKLATAECRQRTRTGGWKWIRSVAKIIARDEAGRPLKVMGTHTDITERKELEEQLLHSQRLEAVGTLASGVAHDLNNILTPMLMASGVLRDKLTDAHDRSMMSLLDEGGRRGAAIVRQLLAFSRNLAQERMAVDPRQLLREMAQLMMATFPKEIRIVESIAEGPERVEAEPTQLHQVLMNLCVNARDAMPQGGTITLGLARTELAETPGLKAGPYLVLSVSDTGDGIPREIMDRIFDPFFTTKPLGKGTGLGLASVHGIVTAHNGIVRVESELHRGSTFRVFLPVRDEERPPIPAKAPFAGQELNTTKTGAGVLVVDDDPGVLLVTARILERKGYSVLQAASGAQALELLRQNRVGVQLVITDFSMPGMDGPTLAPLLKEVSPALRVIGVSGLSQAHRAAELRQLGFVEVLSKPYEWDDLVQAVQRHLPLRGPAG